MNPPRDGVFNANGLSAEFRFLRGTFDRSISIVETATGEHWVHDSQLTYDPPIELAPEAAAVVVNHGLDTEFVQSDDEWQIWTPDETGAIIGSGKTTDEAVSDAVANMEALSAELRRRIPILTPNRGLID